MANPWKTIDMQRTHDGMLELRQRGERDFLILIENRVLMNSVSCRSEEVLGELACRAVARRRNPRVLVSGLGMGLTLRSCLDALPADAAVVVAELNPVIVEWCRGPLADLTGCALADPRVTVQIKDVSRVISGAGAGAFDAIILDLYAGPHARTDPNKDPFYGTRAIEASWKALADGGVFAVWGEAPDSGFEKRLPAAGFNVEKHRPGRGGLRHVVYIAMRNADCGMRNADRHSRGSGNPAE